MAERKPNVTPLQKPLLDKNKKIYTYEEVNSILDKFMMDSVITIAHSLIRVLRETTMDFHNYNVVEGQKCPVRCVECARLQGLKNTEGEKIVNK